MPKKEKKIRQPAKKKKVVKKPAKKPIKKVIKKPAKKVVEKIVKKLAEKPKVKTAKKKIVVTKPIWTVGKRKTAIARVQLVSEGKGEISINRGTIAKHFPYFEFQDMILAPLKLVGQEKSFRFRISVKGGGIRSQTEAVRLGIARALILLNPDWRKVLKPARFLTRDARKKERKKPGLKRARRAPQWRKR